MIERDDQASIGVRHCANCHAREYRIAADKGQMRRCKGAELVFGIGAANTSQSDAGTSVITVSIDKRCQVRVKNGDTAVQRNRGSVFGIANRPTQGAASIYNRRERWSMVDCR